MLSACTQQRAAPLPSGDCLWSLEFREATLFAGATDYHFASPSGVRITFRVENGVTEATGFDAFLAAAEDGPADTNQALVGQKFTVCLAGNSITAAPGDVRPG